MNWLGRVGCGKIGPGWGSFMGAGLAWLNTVFPGRPCVPAEDTDELGLWPGVTVLLLLWEPWRPDWKGRLRVEGVFAFASAPASLFLF